eukprot:gnl/MRDRNA2_/MRDRNA2_30146_c0_seq1.p1 gnl/MRDRNA2_/MRDRNA2_30146_c0~~gnl/MRDRNA2_/MRDRNA2_30146_c0_seq1.p1  ORF type:complete len:346 (+),score=45.12 gnl/MRDRNA2_/MRDRNA2_30146_c0_seq1:118-1155(+)
MQYRYGSSQAHNGASGGHAWATPAWQACPHQCPSRQVPTQMYYLPGRTTQQQVASTHAKPCLAQPQVISEPSDRPPPDSVANHVYLITYKLNKFGMHHAAVFVYGKEWAFGQEIYESLPAMRWQGKKGKSLFMGVTHLKQEEVLEKVEEMRKSWDGAYSLCEANCCHFARQFLAALGVTQEMPHWVDPWTNKVVPVVEKGIGAGVARAAGTAGLSRGATALGTAGMERVGAAGVAEVAGVGASRCLGAPAAAAFVGELAGEYIGDKCGAKDPYSNGTCGLIGSVGAGAAAGSLFAGVSAPIGAVVGAASWGMGKIVKGVVHLATSAKTLDASAASSNSCSSSIKT